MTRVGITGHRGLGTTTTALVADELRQAIGQYPADELVGVSALADGADQLFAQAVLDHGGTLEVIIPATEYRQGLPAGSLDTYDKLIARATKIYRLDHVRSDEQAHMAASEHMLRIVDELIAVWDGQPARGYGGTADVVALAGTRQVPALVMWPDGAARS